MSLKQSRTKTSSEVRIETAFEIQWNCFPLAATRKWRLAEETGILVLTISDDEQKPAKKSAAFEKPVA